MSRYDHKIETSLEGIEHLSKEKNEKDKIIFVFACPLHIVPEWYFLCQYAMLKAVPNKNAGFIILLTSIFTFFFFGEIRNLTTFTRLMDYNNGFSLSSFFLSLLSFWHSTVNLSWVFLVSIGLWREQIRKKMYLSLNLGFGKELISKRQRKNESFLQEFYSKQFMFSNSHHIIFRDGLEADNYYPKTNRFVFL